MTVSSAFKTDRPEAGETNQSFGLFDVLMTEEELAVQVAEVDGIKVYDVYFAITGEK